MGTGCVVVDEYNNTPSTTGLYEGCTRLEAKKLMTSSMTFGALAPE